jgi:hypothetical protein
MRLSFDYLKIKGRSSFEWLSLKRLHTYDRNVRKLGVAAKVFSYSALRAKMSTATTGSSLCRSKAATSLLWQTIEVARSTAKVARNCVGHGGRDELISPSPQTYLGPQTYLTGAERETILTAKSNDARARADASFRKEERAKEGAKAMVEYQANSRMVREKTERLKALRLAKEAADKERAG